MRRAHGRASITSMIETTTSVTVIHGAMLSFEAIGGEEGASVRVREYHETLLRVIEGTATVELDGVEHLLAEEGEARIPAGTPHRLWSAGEDDARIVQEFRRTR
jgi:mannose-6-phosphate isomerase-like protein (cupin superfamily)